VANFRFLMKNCKTSKIGIDIFSGAGGLSLGAEWAGITVRYAVELDQNSAKTYARNHPNTQIIKQDISTVNTADFSHENFFILFGGPPCQGFSVSNRKTRNLENENNGLFKEFLRFVYGLNPEWFLFENVEGLVNFDKGRTLRYILNQFKRIGYTTSEAILYASDYGVPQHRNRFFIVGNRLGINFEFPNPTGKVVTVGEAINDLPILENGAHYQSLPYRENNELSEYASIMRKRSKDATQNFVSKNADYIIERYKYIKPGQNWKAIPEELMSNYKDKNNCHSGIYRRLKEHEPSVVISNYRKNMLIHPLQDRGLSVREAARLQSFPDDFIFEGTIHYIQQQIGNAVPPLLAESIFRKILSYK
jgi:DNA (cytosine-5)-methyltransferase 1